MSLLEEYLAETLSIRPGDLHEDVKIFGYARLRVNGYRVAAEE
jgi:hypothetical protein